MQWSNQQEQALRLAKQWLADPGAPLVFYLAGFAGTGKTTLAQHLVGDSGGRVVYLAYTGKAAHVMRSKGCEGASTIHRAIYKPAGDGPSQPAQAQIAKLLEERGALVGDFTDTDRPPTTAAELARVEWLDAAIAKLRAGARPRFARNDVADVRFASVIVVDECSMVDETIGRDLESFGRKILVLGDPAQLPPVGGGGYFTARRPDVLLTEVHRQAQESGILRLATAVRERGVSAATYGSWGADCDVVRYGDPVLAERAQACDQILVGRNKTRHASNRKIRTLRGITDPMPIVGDKLVCLRNDHEVGILNGSLWQCDGVADGDNEDTIALQVSADGVALGLPLLAWRAHFLAQEVPRFSARDAQEFDFGYALTVHKSQGSQWRDVLVFDESAAFAESGRHLYTAITRASDRLTVAR